MTAEEIQDKRRLNDAEVTKQKAALKEASAERTRLEGAFEEAKLLRAKKVDALLEEHFLGSTAKGVLELVLKMEMTEPTLRQLSDNLGKLTAQEAWHKKRIAELNRENSKLELDMKRLNLIELGESMKVDPLSDPDVFSRFCADLLQFQNISSELFDIDRLQWPERMKRLGVSRFVIDFADVILGHPTTANYGLAHERASQWDRDDNKYFSQQVRNRAAHQLRVARGETGMEKTYMSMPPRQ